MASLNGIEGQAHVEAKDEHSIYHGYIILPPDLINLKRFDIVGPAAKGDYEGPVMMGEKCYIMMGNVSIRKITLSESDLRVEFVGNGEITSLQALTVIPTDYLPSEQIKLNVHPQATYKFNETGLKILSLVKESTSEKPSLTQASHFPGLYISGTITDKDLTGEIRHGLRDGAGKKIGRYFPYQNKQIGLEMDSYAQFNKLCESIQKAIIPPLTISQTAVEDQVFEWIRDRYTGNNQVELMEDVLPKLQSKVAELEIWVPIAQLRIEADVYIGKIVLRPMSEEVITQWLADLLKLGENKEHEVVTEFFDKKIKKKLQGWPAGVIKLTAEPIAAREIALQETERSLAMLKMFSVAALTPKTTCYSAAMGRENYETVTTLIFKNNLFSSYDQQTMAHGQDPWNLDKKFIDELNKIGLGVLSELLRKNKITEFQKSIFDSLTLYSHATGEKELTNKLIYLFAALEGILLKNESEPIQQNLGERIATLIGNDLKGKKDIIKNIKTTYGLRSRFLHHAYTIDDYSELEIFMYNAWRAINTIIANNERFATKEEFVTAIDDQKLAPQTRITPPQAGGVSTRNAG